MIVLSSYHPSSLTLHLTSSFQTDKIIPLNSVVPRSYSPLNLVPAGSTLVSGSNPGLWCGSEVESNHGSGTGSGSGSGSSNNDTNCSNESHYHSEAGTGTGTGTGSEQSNRNSNSNIKQDWSTLSNYTNSNGGVTDINQECPHKLSSSISTGTPENILGSGPGSGAGSSFMMKLQRRSSRTTVEPFTPGLGVNLNNTVENSKSNDEKGGRVGLKSIENEGVIGKEKEMEKDREKKKNMEGSVGNGEDSWYTVGYAIERMAFPLRVISDKNIDPHVQTKSNTSDINKNKNLECNDDDDDNILSDENKGKNIPEQNEEHEQEGLFLDKSLSYAVHNGGGTWTNSIVRSSHCDHRNNEKENLRSSVHEKSSANTKNSTPSNGRTYQAKNGTNMSLARLDPKSAESSHSPTHIRDQNQTVGQCQSLTTVINTCNSVIDQSCFPEKGEREKERVREGEKEVYLNRNIENNDVNNCTSGNGHQNHQNFKQNDGCKGKLPSNEASGCIIN